MCNVTAKINYLTRREFLHRTALMGTVAAGATVFAGCSDESQESEAPQQETTATERSQADKSPNVDANTKVVLLGVGGGPVALKEQHGISQAVVVGDGVYVVDCGTGLFNQLYKAGLIGAVRQADRIRNVFLTHMHSDHTNDYFSFLLLVYPEEEIHTYGPGRPDQMPRALVNPPPGGFPTVDPLGASRPSPASRT